MNREIWEGELLKSALRIEKKTNMNVYLSSTSKLCGHLCVRRKGLLLSVPFVKMVMGFFLSLFERGNFLLCWL
jgi:hypothetical protein